MTKKIFQSILTVSISVLLACFLLITWILYDYFGGMSQNQLKDQLSYATVTAEELGTDGLQRMAHEKYRLTWIGADGTVLYDSHADAADMDSHLDREEIKEALESGTGSSSRYSATLLEKTFYEAQRLEDGSVLRISRNQASVWVLLVGMLQPLVVLCIVAIALSAWLAHKMSKRIVDPLNKLDLEHPMENDAYEELSPLLMRIRSQRHEIEQQVSVLRQKQDEFDHITASMREGLVLLDAGGKILSMNPAARVIFDAVNGIVGTGFLTVERSRKISQAIEEAAKNGHTMLRAERHGRTYQLDISRIESDGKVMGSVILAFDVSEQEFAEQSRREFSANVSHELKTPLTSIIASADLIENNLVKAEDMPRFIGHIRKEAARLLSLIDDIIRLSQLDEGVEIPAEPVDLGSIATEAVEQLRDAAEKSHVSLECETESCIMNGIPRLLHEIVYNLTENAIKYNVPDGTVKVTVLHNGSRIDLKVADTGIGIAPEHQDRVFERFYRVDKSHSKQSGGTGLGLSIVKHAAALFNAEIQMESVPQKGTTITVTFPSKDKS